MMSNEDHLNLDCGVENIQFMINDPEPPRQSPPSTVEEVKILKDHQNEEGTTKERVVKDILPLIMNDVSEQKSSVKMKRSDSALNIFDQTTILKLFSAKNWTETFFNRIFRKKFLVISPGDESLLTTLKHDGHFALEQQLMHLSQKYPRDFLLPAIASSERDKKLNHGLCCFKVPFCMPYQGDALRKIVFSLLKKSRITRILKLFLAKQPTKLILAKNEKKIRSYLIYLRTQFQMLK